MFQAIAFKEWLKIRWAFVALLVVSLVVLGEITLSVQHEIKFRSAITVWTQIVQLGYQYYAHLRYLPLLIGLTLAVAQFVPEMLSNRLTLSLHLPLRENPIMLQMMAVGFTAVAALLLLLLGLITLIGALFFPWEILSRALVNMAPWFLAGCMGYLVVAAALVEPTWMRRILLLVVFVGLAGLLQLDVPGGAYVPSLPLFTALTALCGITILLSAYRFRQGAR